MLANDSMQTSSTSFRIHSPTSRKSSSEWSSSTLHKGKSEHGFLNEVYMAVSGCTPPLARYLLTMTTMVRCDNGSAHWWRHLCPLMCVCSHKKKKKKVCPIQPVHHTHPPSSPLPPHDNDNGQTWQWQCHIDGATLHVHSCACAHTRKKYVPFDLFTIPTPLQPSTSSQWWQWSDVTTAVPHQWHHPSCPFVHALTQWKKVKYVPFDLFMAPTTPLAPYLLMTMTTAITVPPTLHVHSLVHTPSTKKKMSVSHLTCHSLYPPPL